MSLRYAFISAVTLALAAPVAAQPTHKIIYTDLDSDLCSLGVEALRCPGPNGYSILMLGEGADNAILYGLTYSEDQLGGLNWRTPREATKRFGPKVEWHTQSGTPFAAIVRLQAVENGKPVDRLLVSRITEAGSCDVALVDARKKNANQIARKIAQGTITIACAAKEPSSPPTH